ncbi:MAG: efflux RND transporter periplasmic adaptor subunit [Bacteroidia bacterium]
MTKKQLSYIIPLLIIVALAIPKLWCGNNKQSTSTHQAKPNMPVSVSVFVARPTATSANINVSGSLLAAKEVVLYSEIQGRILKIYFNEGEYVKHNQLLAEINVNDLLAQLQKLKAQQKLKQQIFERNKNLVKKGAISDEEYNVSEAELQIANAEVATIEQQIEKSKIRAPFNGFIGISNIYEGSMVGPGTAITAIQQTDKLKLEFSIPEKYAGYVSKGQTITFTTPSKGKKVHEATIYAFEPKVDETTRNLTVRAWFNNMANLNAGAFADVTVKLKQKENIISIPTQSVVPGLKVQKVYVVKADSVVEQVIETGFRSDNKIEVLSGLKAGDSIVVAGIMYMRNNSKVRVGKVENKGDLL